MPYTPHPHHRSGAFASQKSQWLISIEDEIDVYNNATLQGWAGTQCVWGLRNTANGIDVLGVSPTPESHTLKIAKFISDEMDNWHGYPVAFWMSPWDKPEQQILRAWKAAGLISAARLAKIHRGKKCNL